MLRTPRRARYWQLTGTRSSSEATRAFTVSSPRAGGVSMSRKSTGPRSSAIRRCRVWMRSPTWIEACSHRAPTRRSPAPARQVGTHRVYDLAQRGPFAFKELQRRGLQVVGIKAKTGRQPALRIEVEKKTQAAAGEGGPQIDRGAGLGDPALLVGNSDDASHVGQYSLAAAGSQSPGPLGQFRCGPTGDRAPHPGEDLVLDIAARVALGDEQLFLPETMVPGAQRRRDQGVRELPAPLPEGEGGGEGELETRRTPPLAAGRSNPHAQRPLVRALEPHVPGRVHGSCWPAIDGGAGRGIMLFRSQLCQRDGLLHAEACLSTQDKAPGASSTVSEPVCRPRQAGWSSSAAA